MPAISSTTEVYRYRLEFLDRSGGLVYEAPLTGIDFNRAVWDTAFDGFRRGLLPDYAPDLSRARIEPRFAEGAASPQTIGFSVSLPAPAGDEHRADYSTGFFRSRARGVRFKLAQARQVADEDSLSYQLAAYLDDGEPPARGPITIGAAQIDVPIRAMSRADLGATQPWDDPKSDDLPVVVPHALLEEAIAEAESHADREIAGFLLGDVCRDPVDGEVFVAATCLAPAEGCEATSTSVTFQPSSFAHARRLAELRGRNEIVVGWVHSHPFRFCQECPLSTPPECIAKVLFFSVDDEFVMEQTFSQPFMLGLLVGIERKLDRAIGHLPARLYGWRRGEIVQRGFEVGQVSKGP